MSEDHIITEAELKKALANKYEAHPTDIRIKSFEVSAGSNKGDNFACVLKKVVTQLTVRGVDKSDSMMVKCFPPGDYWRAMLQENMMFRTECIMYSNVMPKLNKIAEDHKLEGVTIPKCYYADHETGILAMEDLKELGFIIQGKGTGLPLENMKMVVEQLARLHALSHHWIENYFGGLERFQKDYWTMNNKDWMLIENKGMAELMEGMFCNIINFMVMVLEDRPEEQENLEKVKAFAKVRKERVDAVHIPKGSFNVLNHNDAWCNNFMFKLDKSGKADSIQVIDLQLSRRCRPSVDLAYCFGGSMTPETRQEHTPTLLRHYHNELVKYLVALGFQEDTYPFAQLEADYKDCFPFAFTMAGMHSQMQMTDPHAAGNMNPEGMTSEEASKQMMVEYVEFQKRQAKTNKPLVDRMIALVHEAVAMGGI